MREDDLLVPRFFGLIGACAVVFAGAVLILMRFGFRNALQPYLGMGGFIVLLVLGLAFMLFHAAFDRDLTFRRLYGIFGGAVPLVFGFFLMLVPWPNAIGDMFFLGYLLLTVALLFGLAFLRNETEADLRRVAFMAIGVAGVIMAVVGLLVAGIYSDILLPTGLLLALLGLVYLSSFATNQAGTDLGFYAGAAIGAIGALAVLIALVRSFFPGWFHSGLTDAPTFFIPRGVLLLTAGLVYLFVSIGLTSDNRLVVMTRRELGAYFFSPVVYLVLMAFIIVQWISFMFFVGQLTGDPRDPRSGGPIPEPIVAFYIQQWWPIIFCVVLVPVLTMRLLSEEKRSGTLELLLTSPVDEIHVVLSKFIAGFLMFILMWVPFFLFLISLRMGNNVEEAKKDFDYMPLLGFALALLITGANFISIGLFFSSLTKDQITSVVLTFAAMLGLTMVFFIRRLFFQREELPGPDGTTITSAWSVVLRHISYIDTWFETMDGKLILKYLLFPISSAIFFLFLTTKVLEARKWS